MELYESRKGGKPPTQHFVSPKGDPAAWKAWMQKPVLDAFLKAAPQDGPKLLDMLGRL